MHIIGFSRKFASAPEPVNCPTDCTGYTTPVYGVWNCTVVGNGRTVTINNKTATWTKTAGTSCIHSMGAVTDGADSISQYSLGFLKCVTQTWVFHSTATESGLGAGDAYYDKANYGTGVTGIYLLRAGYNGTGWQETMTLYA